MNDHREKILRLPPNRVWRTYSGGLMLDRMEGRAVPTDGPFPEDWLGSTTRAINPGQQRKDEGLAHVVFDSQNVILADLIAADPEYFLGAAHLASFGIDPMVLVKLLDSAVRLALQVHPTVDFSQRFLNTSSGKTEAYYILNIRPEVADPFIYLGFQRPPTRKELHRMIVEQDISAMEACFDRIPVRPGDVYLVPGGLPHAIGGGVLMVEVMEPTDFVARVEFNVAGRTIPEPARFMGRDVDFALDMFSLAAWPAEEIQAKWRCEPRIFEQESELRRESLVDERLTNRFRVNRVVLTGSTHWKSSGFTVLVVVEGSCFVTTAQEVVHLQQFERIIVPYGLQALDLTAQGHTVLLECCSPLP